MNRLTITSAKLLKVTPPRQIRQANTRLAPRIIFYRNYGPVSSNAVATIIEHRCTMHKLRPATVPFGHLPVSKKKQERKREAERREALAEFFANFSLD
jgi:hypothetical protein